jgi:hypothetical protein
MALSGRGVSAEKWALNRFNRFNLFLLTERKKDEKEKAFPPTKNSIAIWTKKAVKAVVALLSLPPQHVNPKTLQNAKRVKRSWFWPWTKPPTHRPGTTAEPPANIVFVAAPHRETEDW